MTILVEKKLDEKSKIICSRKYFDAVRTVQYCDLGAIANRYYCHNNNFAIEFLN